MVYYIMSRKSIIYLNLRLWQKIDLLATDKSRRFSQPRGIVVKYCTKQDDESTKRPTTRAPSCDPPGGFM